MNLIKTLEVFVSADEIAQAIAEENEDVIRDEIQDLFDEDENGQITYYGDTAAEIDCMLTDEVEIELFTQVEALVDDCYHTVDVTINVRLTFLVWDIMADSDTAPVVEVEIDSLTIDTPYGSVDAEDLDEIAEVEEALMRELESCNLNPFFEEPRYLN